MKKLLALTLAAAIGLTACTNGSNPNQNGNNGSNGGNGAEAAATTFEEELSGEITVYAFESMLQGEFLQEAARMFMDANPGTIVNVATFSSMPEIRRAEGAGGAQVMIAQAGDRTAERRDYVNMINTELMSGRGPDVMAIDALPFQAFAENGQLLNLRPFMEADPRFNMEDFRENILDAVTSGTGSNQEQFVFPLDYDFRYLTYDSSLLAEDAQAQISTRAEIPVLSFEELMELGRESFAEVSTPEEHIPILSLMAGIQGGLFTELFRQNHNYFIDLESERANFDSGVFARMLNRIITYEEAGYLLPRLDMAELAGEISAGGGGRGRFLNQRSIFAPRQATRLLNEFMDEQSAREGVRITGGAMGIGSEYDKIAGIMGNSHGEVPFTVTMGLGINSNTENPRLAWEFIRFAASDAMMDTMRMIGLPTYIRALEERAAFSLEGQNLADYIQTAENFTAMLNTFYKTDAIIEDIVRTEVQAFFDGDITAEEAAQRLQSRVGLMLSE